MPTLFEKGAVSKVDVPNAKKKILRAKRPRRGTPQTTQHARDPHTVRNATSNTTTHRKRPREPARNHASKGRRKRSRPPPGRTPPRGRQPRPAPAPIPPSSPPPRHRPRARSSPYRRRRLRGVLDARAAGQVRSATGVSSTRQRSRINNIHVGQGRPNLNPTNDPTGTGETKHKNHRTF